MHYPTNTTSQSAVSVTNNELEGASVMEEGWVCECRRCEHGYSTYVMATLIIIMGIPLFLVEEKQLSTIKDQVAAWPEIAYF